MSAPGGEQGPHPLELEVATARAERDAARAQVEQLQAELRRAHDQRDHLALELEQARVLGVALTRERDLAKAQRDRLEAEAQKLQDNLLATRERYR